MPARRFIQCDVFTPRPTQGNGLAVVVDADGLSERQMQDFAAWTNLAETTFLLPPTAPEADYRVRIFTPLREMVFAGHPTLGSCAAWLHAGGAPRRSGVVKQECKIGIVDIDLGGPVPAFVAPATTVAPLPDEHLSAITEALAIPAEAVVRGATLANGPVWQALELASARAVLDARAGAVRWPEFKPIGLIGPYPAGAECDYEVRMLAPSSGMLEDPITGSLNAALAHWMAGQGRLRRPVVVAQGTVINRYGRVHIQPADGGRILIGGETHILITGEVRI